MNRDLNRVTYSLLSAIILFLASCSDKDYYDPSYQTENPLDITAPSSFDWSMTKAAQLNVTVDDEFDGQYLYTIEVFEENPLTNENATPIAKGVANKGVAFATTLSLNKSQKGIFIQQTDPKGRSVVRCYDASNQINASFGTKVAGVRALASFAAEIIIPPVPAEYASVPANAILLDNPGVNKELQGGKSYVLHANHNGKIEYYSSGQDIKLYIAEGVKWTLSADQTFQSYLTVILAEGASIESSALLNFVNGSSLIINPNASVNVKNIGFTNNSSVLLNWGSLTVSETLSMPNNNSTKNYGTIKAKEIFLPNASDYVNDGDIETGKLTLNSDSKITNNKSLVVAEELQLTNTGCIVNNNNYIKCPSARITNGVLNNNCYFECEGLFHTNGATINLKKGYIVAQNMKLEGTKINFLNGSMIEAKVQIDHSSYASTYDGGTAERSLMKAPKIIGQGFTYKGNLTIESDDHVAKSKDWNNYTITAPAELAKLGESTVFIEDCMGIRNGGNPGGDPEDPELPIITVDEKDYTYLFEDQWPFYGDYDMNDAVIKVKNMTLYSNKENKAEKMTFEFSLQAIGASKALAIATSLDNVEASVVKSVSYSQKTPTTFDINGSGVENGQSAAVIPLIDHAHQFLGQGIRFVNTERVDVTNLPTITVTVEFNAPVPVADLSASHFNLFIVSDVDRISVRSNSRKEIHVYGCSPTDKADTSYFGNNDDGSNVYGKYASRDNLAWGVIIPDNFKWAKEYIPLTTAYSDFKEWITSGGTAKTDWYNRPTADKVISLQ